MLSIDFINNQSQSSNSPQLYSQQVVPEQPVYQQNPNQQQIYQGFGTQPPMYGNVPLQTTNNQYQNITLSTNI